MPLGTNEATNYLANNNDLLQYYRDNIAGTPEEANYGGNILRFASAHYDMAGATEIAENKRPANSLAPFVPTGGGTAAETAGSTTLNFTAPPPPDPVDLAPVQSAISGVAGSIGTPTTAQTDANQTTLMGQTAGLATGQQGIRDIVTPLGEQVTGIGTQIGTADTDAGQTDLFAGQRGIMSGIGTAGTGTTPGTGLVGGQANIQAGIGTAGEGQTDLFAGQAGLAGGQTTLSENQVALQEGQTGLGTQIGALGTAGVTGEDGTVTQKPTGLYAGQAGLMSGQTGLGTQLTGVGRDITAELGDVSSTLGGQIGAFQTAAEQYQRGATTQRGDIQGTQRANQAAMTQQVQGVGQQTNRTAEMMAQQRQQPAVQQQAAQFAQSAPRATPSNQQVGPMGPMAADPRDVLIQNLMRRNASLMNNRPV